MTSVKIQISGGGVTYGYTRGRSPLLVLPAGHLGSAVVSASLVLAGFSILAASIPLNLTICMPPSDSPSSAGKDCQSHSSGNNASLASLGRQGQGIHSNHFFCGS